MLDFVFATEVAPPPPPPPVSAGPVPLISGIPRMGQVLTANHSLTNPTYEWLRDGSVIPGATGLNYTVGMMDMMVSGMGVHMSHSGGAELSVRVQGDEGTFTSPSVKVYHTHDEASHVVDDDAVRDLVKHIDATHIAINNGNWTTPGTWHNGIVPGAGANVLIAHGVEVIYDRVSSPRLNTVRVDGVLKAALNQSTDMLVETIVVTLSGKFEIGNEDTGSLLHPYVCKITISNRSYGLNQNAQTNLDIVNDPLLLGRGILVQGEWNTSGDRKTARPFASTFPMAGDTSITLINAPTRWRVGDEISVPGTGGRPQAHRQPWMSQTERRVITSITNGGRTLHFSAPLAFNHDEQNPNVTRDDLFLPIYNLTRNIVIESEDHENISVPRRGHCMVMHDAVKADLWDIQFHELGRTDKSFGSGRKEGNQLRFPPRTPAYSTSTQTETFDAESNLQGRYPLHFHFVGFRVTGFPSAHYCIVVGTPGWGMVDHGGKSKFEFCQVTEFRGAGMVSETGDETSIWVECDCWHTTALVTTYGQTKSIEDGAGRTGDFGWSGVAYILRGRAMRTNRNYGLDCHTAHAYWHRDAANSVAPLREMVRSTLDLKDLGVFEGRTADTMEVPDYPIVHQSDNVGIGCVYGFFVSKSNVWQRHGLNVELKNFFGWALLGGMVVEYIGQYLVNAPDVVCRSGGQRQAGVQVGNNSNQVVVRDARTEGFVDGIRATVGTIFSPISEWNNTNNPMFTIINHTGVRNDNDIRSVGNAQAASVVRIIPGSPTYIEPSINIPFIVFDFNGGNTSNYQTGTITDTLGTRTIPPSFDNLGLRPTFSKPAIHLAKHGYWTYQGQNIGVFPFYYSDRATGRPHKIDLAFRLTGGVGGYTNNGAFTRSSADPQRPNFSVSTPRNTPINIDVLSAATVQPGGSAFISDSYYSPQQGTLVFNGNSISVDYTPDPNFVGKDLFRMFISDGRGRYRTADVTVNVT